MPSGWIKLHRQILEWEWYSDINTFRLFTHLLLTANRKPKRWRGLTIGRGQKLTSRAKLSAETGLSEREIRTSLNRLKSTNELTIKSTKKETVITLCKYDTYQSKDGPGDQQNDQPLDQQATNRRPSNEQEGEEGKKRERRIPTKSEWLEYAKETRPDWPKADAENAWDYYDSINWMRGRNPIQKWKQCISTCYKNWKTNGRKIISRDTGTLNDGAFAGQEDEIDNLFK